MYLFIILLIVVLVIIYVLGNRMDGFTVGFDSNFMSQEPVDYSTKKQNCNELTYNPTECITNTVVPSNKIVCTESLTPNDNNNKNRKLANSEDTKNPTLSLIYDFDLLSSFNNAQINNDNMVDKELESFDDLKTDIKSLASLENDNITN